MSEICNACQAAIEDIDYPFTCTCPIPTVLPSGRTTCRECGEELWGADESHGLCVSCQDRERDEELHAYYDDRDEDPDPTDGHDEDLRDYDDACEAE